MVRHLKALKIALRCPQRQILCGQCGKRLEPLVRLAKALKVALRCPQRQIRVDRAEPGAVPGDDKDAEDHVAGVPRRRVQPAPERLPVHRRRRRLPQPLPGEQGTHPATVFVIFVWQIVAQYPQRNMHSMLPVRQHGTIRYGQLPLIFTSMLSQSGKGTHKRLYDFRMPRRARARRRAAGACSA